MPIRLDAYITPELKARLVRAARAESDRLGARFPESEIVRQALDSWLTAWEAENGADEKKG